MLRLVHTTAILAAVTLLGQAPAVAQTAPETHTTWSAETPEEVRRMIVAEAVANGLVPPELALAVAHEESNFDPGALSRAGARGVMQIMPSTARYEFGVEPDTLWNARVSIEIGVAYLERLYQRYGGSWPAALSHYNGGSVRTNARGDAVTHGYTRQYVADVTRRWNEYKADGAVAALVADARASQGQAGPVAIAGDRMPRRTLLEDIEQARLSFRRALQAHRERGW